MPNHLRISSKKTLAGVVGTAAAALLLAFVPEHEGEALTTYYDPVGVATVCYGDTDPALAVPGASYTRADCLQSLERQLIAHAEPVLACTPGLAGHPRQLAAAVSLAYNIGPSAYCKSTVARRFNAGDWAGACAAFAMWNKAGGKVLPGLVRRRADERALCESTLSDAREPSRRPRSVPVTERSEVYGNREQSGGQPRSVSELRALPGEAKASVAQDVRPSVIMQDERALCEQDLPQGGRP